MGGRLESIGRRGRRGGWLRGLIGAIGLSVLPHAAAEAACTPPDCSLDLGSSGAYVTFGSTSTLGLPSFTIESDGGVTSKGGDLDATRSTPGIGELARLARELPPGKPEGVERRAAWDGGAAPRITAHLGAWLRGRTTGQTSGSGVQGAGT